MNRDWYNLMEEFIVYLTKFNDQIIKPNGHPIIKLYSYYEYIAETEKEKRQ